LTLRNGLPPGRFGYLPAPATQLELLFEHDLFAKPVPTFADHALKSIV
jgi:hypothetical protein